MMLEREIDWKEFLGWDDDHLQDLRFAGYSYIRQGKYDLACPFFEALVVFDPENEYDLQTTGALYLELGKSERALEILEQALLLTPDHIPTVLNKAKALLILGHKNRGLRLAQTLQKFPEEYVSNSAVALILAYS